MCMVFIVIENFVGIINFMEFMYMKFVGSSLV